MKPTKLLTCKGTCHAEVGDSGVPGGPIPEVQRPKLSLRQAFKGALAGLSHSNEDRDSLKAASAGIGRSKPGSCGRSLSAAAAGATPMSETGAAAHPAARPFACLGRLFRTGQHPHP